MIFLLDGITFGTVDFSTIWSVVVPMVETFAPLLIAVIGLQVALMAVQAIAGGLADAREKREDAMHAALDAEVLAIDGVSTESGVLGKFSPWSAPDSALGGRSGDLDDFLADFDLGAASVEAFDRLLDSDVPSLVTDSGAESDVNLRTFSMLGGGSGPVLPGLGFDKDEHNSAREDDHMSWTAGTGEYDPDFWSDSRPSEGVDL